MLILKSPDFFNLINYANKISSKFFRTLHNDTNKKFKKVQKLNIQLRIMNRADFITNIGIRVF